MADQREPGTGLARRDVSREAEILTGEVVGAPRPAPVRVIRAVRVVARHEHSRAAARNVAYLPIGVYAVISRLWDSRSTARYERFMRSAERTGDHASALEWEARASQFRKDRHERRMDWIERPARIALLLPKILGGLFLLLAAIGVFLGIATRKLAEIAVPFEVVGAVVKWVVIAVSVSYGPILLAAPWIALSALWWAGRRHANATMTGWAAAPARDDDDGGIIVTADTIVLALQNLRVPELKKAFRDGWRPVFHTQPVRDGRGYAAVFGLPLGVTAAMIADQRPVLARNVHRAEVEVWPSDAEKAGTGPAGTVALWIADSGVLSKAAPEYPLMHEGTADVFTGVPAGISPRGDEISVPIVAANIVVGGQMGMGKSNAARVIMLGCALDPIATLDVFVFANNGDFDSYRPRLARYVKGLEDDVIEAAVDRLRGLYAEVGRREGRLSDLGAKKVTRGLAEAHPDMRPVICLFSECHELFGHAELGAEAAELATKTAKRARKTGITLIFDTQSSRKEGIPPKLTELVSVNACFYVKSWRSNDGFLGDGSFAAGIRATELRPGRDRGTSLITGVSEQQFELLRWYFVEVDDDTGFDAAAEVIARAVAGVAPGGRASAAALPAAEARDLLSDLAEVLGDDRAKLADLPALLRDLAPRWAPYRTLSGTRLAELLAAEGIRVTNSGNVPRLDPADLRRAAGGPGEGQDDGQDEAS